MPRAILGIVTGDAILPPSCPPMKEKWPKRGWAFLLPECCLEVADVLLGLLEQRAQSLGHIGET
jgi:hypothetical protein